MDIRKLPWAGISIQSNNHQILIDPISPLANIAKVVFGEAKEDFFPLDQLGSVDAVLHTHTHTDHFDPSGIIKAFGNEIPVYVPFENVEEAYEAGLMNVIGARVGDTFTIGDFRVIASKAVDGFGSPQISWIVEGEGRKIIHSGDTLWHGFWWGIKKQYGPFDAALLPINGAFITLPNLEPSHQLATMTPEQASAAAKLLGAHTFIPIHYKTYHSPPAYIQQDDPEKRIIKSNNDKGIRTVLLNSKEVYSL